MMRCPECGSKNTKMVISACRKECGILEMSQEEDLFEPQDPILPYTYENPTVESFECETCGYYEEMKKQLRGEFYPSELEEEVMKLLKEVAR